MSSIRDMKRYLEANIEAALKVPLRKAKGSVLGTPQLPSAFPSFTTTKNTILPVEWDNRKYLVAYNRKDIQAFMTPLFMPGQYLPLLPAHAKVSDFLPVFNKRWGLDFKLTDVVDEPLALTTTAGATTVRLTMSATNLWFTGTLQIPVWPMQVEGSKRAYAVDWSPVIVTAKPTLNDTTRKLIDGTLLTYTLDYSAANTACAAVTQVADRSSWNNGAAAQQTALATALSAIDGVPWVAVNGLAAYNLYNSHCIYNGPTEGFKASMAIVGDDGNTADYPTNAYTRYDKYVNLSMMNVLVLQLNHNNTCTNVGGVLFIHYGGLAPAVVEQAYRAPLHYWPLNGNLKSAIAGDPDLALPVAWYTQTDGYVRPALAAAGGYPIGVTLPANSDYTLSLTMRIGWRAALDYIGILSDSTLTTHNGALLFNSASIIYQQNVISKWLAPNGEAVLKYCENVILTIVKRGNIYRYYINGLLVNYAELAAGITLPDYTHFGKVAGYPFPTNFVFYDFYYYDYALSAGQVEKLARGDYGSTK